MNLPVAIHGSCKFKISGIWQMLSHLPANGDWMSGIFRIENEKTWLCNGTVAVWSMSDWMDNCKGMQELGTFQGTIQSGTSPLTWEYAWTRDGTKLPTWSHKWDDAMLMRNEAMKSYKRQGFLQNGISWDCTGWNWSQLIKTSQLKANYWTQPRMQQSSFQVLEQCWKSGRQDKTECFAYLQGNAHNLGSQWPPGRSSWGNPQNLASQNIHRPQVFKNIYGSLWIVNCPGPTHTHIHDESCLIFSHLPSLCLPALRHLRPAYSTSWNCCTGPSHECKESRDRWGPLRNEQRHRQSRPFQSKCNDDSKQGHHPQHLWP